MSRATHMFYHIPSFTVFGMIYMVTVYSQATPRVRESTFDAVTIDIHRHFHPILSMATFTVPATLRGKVPSSCPPALRRSSVHRRASEMSRDLPQ